MKEKNMNPMNVDKKHKASRTPKYIIIPAIALVIIAGAVLLMLQLFADTSVAKVGDSKISKTVYTYFLNDIARQIESGNGISTADAQKTFWNTQVKAEELMQLKDKAMENAANFQVQLVKAKKATSLTDSDRKNVDTYVNNIIGQISGITYDDVSKTEQKKAEEAADTKIQTVYGITLAEFKNIYSDQTLITKFADSEKAKLKTTDKEIKAYYEKNTNSLDKMTVKHILLKTSDDSGTAMTDKQIKAVKKKADGILEQLKNGADFKKLVDKYTEDTASKSSGGEYTFKRGEMVTEFENWAFDAKRKAGDLDIVKTKYGYHIMLFVGKKGYNDIKADAKAALETEKYTDIVADWRKEKEFKLTKNAEAIAKINIKIDESSISTAK